MDANVMFPQEVMDKLNTPLIPEDVKVRRGGGQSLIPFLSWDVVVNKANDIFDIDGWDTEIRDLNQREVYAPGPNNTMIVGGVFYTVTVRVTTKYGPVSEGIGTGAAHLVNRQGQPLYPAQAMSAMDTAVKGAESDAQKRAFRRFGKAFGLELYDKDYAQNIAQMVNGRNNGGQGQGYGPPYVEPGMRPPAQPAQNQGGKPTCQQCPNTVGIMRNGQPFRLCVSCNQKKEMNGASDMPYGYSGGGYDARDAAQTTPQSDDWGDLPV